MKKQNQEMADAITHSLCNYYDLDYHGLRRRYGGKHNTIKVALTYLLYYYVFDGKAETGRYLKNINHATIIHRLKNHEQWHKESVDYSNFVDFLVRRFVTPNLTYRASDTQVNKKLIAQNKRLIKENSELSQENKELRSQIAEEKQKIKRLEEELKVKRAILE